MPSKHTIRTSTGEHRRDHSGLRADSSGTEYTSATRDAERDHERDRDDGEDSVSVDLREGRRGFDHAGRTDGGARVHGHRHRRDQESEAPESGDGERDPRPHSRSECVSHVGQTLSYERMTPAQRRSKGRRDHGVRGPARRRDSQLRACSRRGRDVVAAHRRDRGRQPRGDHLLLRVEGRAGGTALAEELREWTRPALDRLSAADDPASRLLGTVEILGTAFDQHRDRVPGLLEVFVHTARDADPNNPVVAVWIEVRRRLAARDRGAAGGLDDRRRGSIPTPWPP